MISCNQCQVGADFGEILRHSNCHHVSERSMKLRLKGRGIVKASNIEVKTPTYVTPCRMFCTLQYINTIMITCHDWKHLSKVFLISKAFSSLLCLQNHISENCGISVAYLFKKIELGFRKPGFEGFANPTPNPCPLSSRPISFPCLERLRIPENCDWSRWQGDKGSICKAMQSFWALNFCPFDKKHEFLSQNQGLLGTEFLSRIIPVKGVWGVLVLSFWVSFSRFLDKLKVILDGLEIWVGQNHVPHCSIWIVSCLSKRLEWQAAEKYTEVQASLSFRCWAAKGNLKSNTNR